MDGYEARTDYEKSLVQALAGMIAFAYHEPKKMPDITKKRKPIPDHIASEMAEIRMKVIAKRESSFLKRGGANGH